jgi:hypothetical protein
MFCGVLDFPLHRELREVGNRAFEAIVLPDIFGEHRSRREEYQYINDLLRN